MPAMLASSSGPRCAGLPAPPDANVYRPGLRLRERDELRQCLRRNGVVDQNDVRARRDHADRCEIPHRVVPDIREHRGRNREHRGIADADGVAIRFAARHLPRREVATRPRLVLDHDLLAEKLSHFLGDHARDSVISAACRRRHQQRDRARRIGLGVREICGEGECEGKKAKQVCAWAASKSRALFYHAARSGNASPAPPGSPQDAPFGDQPGDQPRGRHVKRIVRHR